MNEIEELVPLEYPGIMKNVYFISRNGEIYSTFKKRLIKPADHIQGYYVVTLKDTCGRYVKLLLHRLVAWQFVDGYTEERCIVNHKDGNKKNTYYTNLEWVTYSENAQHAVDNGLTPMINKARGKDHPGYKYTDEMIHYICSLLSEGIKPKMLTQKFILNYPSFSDSEKAVYKYIKTKIKSRLYRTDISSQYSF